MSSQLLVIWSLFLVPLKYASLASCHTPASCSGSKFGEFSSFIPFHDYGNNLDLAQPMTLNVTVETIHSRTLYNHLLPMDTGSTGVAIGAKSLGLNDWNLHQYPRGTEYLSSSRILWEGYWVDAKDVNLTFTGTGLTANVPIFAVTIESVCTEFVNGACCPGHKEHIHLWPEDVHYLGLYKLCFSSITFPRTQSRICFYALSCYRFVNAIRILSR